MAETMDSLLLYPGSQSTQVILPDHNEYNGFQDLSMFEVGGGIADMSVTTVIPDIELNPLIDETFLTTIPANQSHPESLLEPQCTRNNDTTSPASPRAVGGLNVPRGGTSQVAAEVCSCQDLMRTYEMVQLRLVWGTKNNTTKDDIFGILRCQKSVLRSCMAVVECEHCNLLSEQCVMLIAICDSLVASMAIVQEAAAQQTGCRNPKVTKLTHRFGLASETPTRLEQNDLVNRCGTSFGSMISDSGSPSQRKGKTGGYPDSASESGREARGWEFDEEDAASVLHSLLEVRITRLEALIKKVEDLVTMNCWNGQMVILRELLQRLEIIRLRNC